MIARKGRFVEYSVFGQKTTVDWTIISDAKELEIRGGHLGPYTYPTAIRMIANGKIPVDKIVTNYASGGLREGFPPRKHVF